MWILGSLPWDYTRSLCPEIVDRALSHRHAGIARRLLGGMPHAVIAEVVPPIMAQVLVEADYDLTCTLLVTCAVEHVGYVVGGHGLGLELSAGQSDGDVLQGAQCADDPLDAPAGTAARVGDI